MREARTWLGLVGLLLLTSSCFYTDIINETPMPGIRVLRSGPYFVGDAVTFDATKSLDDSASELVATWQARECSEERVPRCQPLGDPLLGSLDTVFRVDLASHDTVEVQLRVTDALGASRIQPDIYSIEVGNRAPALELQASGHQEGIGGPFVLYRGINLIAIPDEGLEGFDADGDEVGLNWRVLPPATSQSSARSFEPSGATGYVLTPDVEGAWSVIVSADDGVGEIREFRKDFFVAGDAPPCLQGMEPQAYDDAYYVVDDVRRFSVLSVQDTLDPFPASIDEDPSLGRAQFQWFLQTDEEVGFVPLSGHAAADYVIDPEVYEPGDYLALRVEVADRVEGPERALVCADGAWSCSLNAGSGCYQRKTWGVEIR